MSNQPTETFESALSARVAAMADAHTDDDTFAARVRAADALRRLGHAVVGHDPDVTTFDEIARCVAHCAGRTATLKD